MFFHQRLAESQGTLQGLLYELLLCTLPLCLLSIQVPGPCSLERPISLTGQMANL